MRLPTDIDYMCLRTMNPSSVNYHNLILEAIPEYGNDEKMQAMFSIFPDKELNSSTWTSRMTFWKLTLNTLLSIKPRIFASEDNLIVSNQDSLSHILTRNNIIPSGIAVVLVCFLYYLNDYHIRLT